LEEAGALEDLPAVGKCLSLVMERPQLRPMFDRLADEARTYAEMQARGVGVV